MTPEQAFAQILRGLRSKAGITQEQLAFDANLDRTYISLLERGLRQPTLGTMLQLCDALRVSPATLMNDIQGVLREVDAS